MVAKNSFFKKRLLLESSFTDVNISLPLYKKKVLYVDDQGSLGYTDILSNFFRMHTFDSIDEAEGIEEKAKDKIDSMLTDKEPEQPEELVLEADEEI